MTKYQNFRVLNGVYTANTQEELVPSLPPGAYTLIQDNKGRLYFKTSKLNYDEIVDLPSKEYSSVTKELEYFLKPETESKFREYGFLYKRSTLLHGLPGTGKTVIVNRIARDVIESGGIVLFNPEPRFLETAFEQIDDLQPNQRCMVIFEELDQLIKHNEGALLSILDGEVQKDNIVYVATTNFIKRVPQRICRPGRFSTIVHVKYPSIAARKAYLERKLEGKEHNIDINTWAKATGGFSIDELKETVLSTQCLGQKLEDVIKRVKEVQEDVKNNVKSSDLYEDDYYVDSLEELVDEVG